MDIKGKTMLDRDNEGKFVESPEQLLPEDNWAESVRYPKLEALSKHAGKSMAELAREAVHM